MNRLTMTKHTLPGNLRLIPFWIVFTVLLSCQNEQYLVNAFEIDGKWGYCILKDNKLIIKQTTIPTLPHFARFKSREDALKVGHLVAERIKKNLPPTVHRKDLILLKIEP